MLRAFVFLPSIAAMIAGASVLAQETKIVGSSTVSNFAHVVHERMGDEGESLVIETTGTGGGFTLFCNSNDPSLAPVTLASRGIKERERAECESANVGNIRGYDLGLSGVVIAQKKRRKPMRLTVRDLYLALSSQIPLQLPDGKCRLVQNPHTVWSEVRPNLPDWRIEVFGPPLTSGTRSSFIDLALIAGAKEISCMRALNADDPSAFKAAVTTLRSDGAWIDVGENDSVLIAAISQMPTALGVVGYPLFQGYGDTLSAVAVNNIVPNVETISADTYPLSRVLRIYAKLDAVGQNATARAFLDRMISKDAIGKDGFLKPHGLIPIAAPEDTATTGCAEGRHCSQGL